MMKFLAQCYTQHVNRKRERTGSLWDSRFRSCLVASERYALACYRYVELNPVSARMVEHPREYRWSSYRANAEGAPDPLVRPHPAYPGVVNYGQLFEDPLDTQIVHDIRKATNGGYAAGTLRRSRGRQMRKMRSVPI